MYKKTSYYKQKKLINNMHFDQAINSKINILLFNYSRGNNLIYLLAIVIVKKPFTVFLDLTRDVMTCHFVILCHHVVSSER